MLIVSLQAAAACEALRGGDQGGGQVHRPKQRDSEARPQELQVTLQCAFCITMIVKDMHSFDPNFVSHSMSYTTNPHHHSQDDDFLQHDRLVPRGGVLAERRGEGERSHARRRGGPEERFAQHARD